MGYELHITRKANWYEDSGPEITLGEWRAYAEADPEMRIDGFAEIETPDGTLRMQSPGLAVWLAYSRHGESGNMAWFSHFRDRVSVKNPDEEIIRKMHRVAVALGARLQGDEGELYGPDGASNRGEIRQGAAESLKRPKAPWWKIWS